MHAFVRGCLAIMRIVPRSGRPSPAQSRILLTGTFFSENWILNHLRPLLNSEHCGHVTLICTFPLAERAKLTVLPPPRLLMKIAGRTPGRLIYFIFTALKLRPDVIGGFHISLNALVAGVLSRLLRAKSLYFCGGGPREVLGGGFYAGNNSMNLEKADDKLEALLLRCVLQLDLVITMGSRTIQFFEQKGVRTHFTVIPGGIDTASYKVEADAQKEFDLIFVGRLVQVKRVDLLLEAVRDLRKAGVQARTVIIGSGELEEALKQQAKENGVADLVLFAGHQKNVSEWLRKSKVFVLTSDSEGLSLALMEAMSCGLPSVVSDVGELGELVEDGENGFLVKERTGAAFANSLQKLLADGRIYAEMAEKSATAAKSVKMEEATRKWDNLLSGSVMPRRECPDEISNCSNGTRRACSYADR